MPGWTSPVRRFGGALLALALVLAACAPTQRRVAVEPLVSPATRAMYGPVVRRRVPRAGDPGPVT